MTNSISQINSKKTVFSAQNILLKRSFLILFLLLSVTTNYADNVDFNTALRIARAYVNTSKKDAQNIKTRAAATATQQPYYIFNDEAGKGFVVIAGDDKMGKVLIPKHVISLTPIDRYMRS